MQERTENPGRPTSDNIDSTTSDLSGELRATGLVWDDEARAVTLTRQPWMSDRQWRIIRDGMVAHLEAEGFVREVAR